ncbi:phosphodiester glycosidase family protein [Vulcanococcus limneticus]|uniref:phosphodiester glycosidase family protein n=1 Tax=Vulcanococcus limneticus TaxID=2170428 RepID=UPI00398BCCFF
MAALLAHLPLAAGLSVGLSAGFGAVPFLLALAPGAAEAAPRAGADSVLVATRAGQASQQGGQIAINGRIQQARWQWSPATAANPAELWLPLEVLQDQLGVASSTSPSGELNLEWYGRRASIPALAQRSLEDEVAVPALALLTAAGVRVQPLGDRLELELPAAGLGRIRFRDLGSARRIVLDLAGPALVQRGEAGILLGLRGTPEQERELQALGLRVRREVQGLRFQPASGTAPKLLTLGGPDRLVLEFGDGAAATVTPERPAALDPRLQQLLGQGLRIDRRVLPGGSGAVVLSSVRLDPRAIPLDLRPLTRPDGMQGLSSLGQLARGEQALIAINGGYFNRVRRLPLGALRSNGRWLSGPILNRGAIGWRDGNMPSFGRLSLQEWVSDGRGQRWPLATLNSGYVQRGLSRYTADWGRSYQALSGNESAVLVRDGVVLQRFEGPELAAGIPLDGPDQLLVARGGSALPWNPGERLSLASQPSDGLGQQPFVVGGGPLLLQGGQLVLNGGAEGFSPTFLEQGAPRTVIGSDGNQLWLVTLQGANSAGPTLLETARLLQQLGLRDALNLDGGSSTGLVVGDTHTVRGRGVVASVHNGLGLVPRGAGPAAATGGPARRAVAAWGP